MEKFQAFVAFLKITLNYHYNHRVCPAHDMNHSREMILLGRKIKALSLYKTLDLDEFEVACWIHSTDRSGTLRETIGFKNGMPMPEYLEKWKAFLTQLLADSPFDYNARDRIIDAVLQHAKKDDESKDSVLLTSLRIADKVVRFSTIGISSISANHRDNAFYDVKNPFNYDSTEETKLKSVYNDFCRVLEWYKMLPSDQARSLISIDDLKFQVLFQRRMGAQIAEIAEKKNEVENDIMKALGKYYELVKED
jgi:hypothetical protein